MKELDKLKQMAGIIPTGIIPKPVILGQIKRPGGTLMSNRVPKPKNKILNEDKVNKMNELKKLLENAGMLKESPFDGEAYSNRIAEMNPDGTISDDEGERIAQLMATFESELDDLISWALKEADDIGGQFRSPGIQRQLRMLLKGKLDGMRGRTTTSHYTGPGGVDLKTGKKPGGM